MSKRIVVKVGPSSLTGSAGSHLEADKVDALVDALAFVELALALGVEFEHELVHRDDLVLL